MSAVRDQVIPPRRHANVSGDFFCLFFSGPVIIRETTRDSSGVTPDTGTTLWRDGHVSAGQCLVAGEKISHLLKPGEATMLLRTGICSIEWQCRGRLSLKAAGRRVTVTLFPAGSVGPYPGVTPGNRYQAGEHGKGERILKREASWRMHSRSTDKTGKRQDYRIPEANGVCRSPRELS